MNGGAAASSTRSIREVSRTATETVSATFHGITAKLDYVAKLGVDCFWVSPFFKSPMKDFGYDITDYCDVDPMFGTLEDFDAMMRRC